MATKLILYGAGSFARMMRLYFDRLPKYRVCAYCVDDEFMPEIHTFDDLPLVSFDRIESRYNIDEYQIFVSVGYSNMRARMLMYEKAKAKGYKFPNYIDKSAKLDETVVLGDNNVVLMNSVIEPFTKLGSNNIIWSSVTISHDVEISDNCFVASQVLIGGRCQIDQGCFIGFASTCVQDVVLGEETLVGAKSLVLTSTQRYSKNIGIPSRVVSFHRDKGIIVA